MPEHDRVHVADQPRLDARPLRRGRELAEPRELAPRPRLLGLACRREQQQGARLGRQALHAGAKRRVEPAGPAAREVLQRQLEQGERIATSLLEQLPFGRLAERCAANAAHHLACVRL